MAIYSESMEKRTHEIRLVDRGEMSISGVDEVVGFDEENLRLRTSVGELFVEGTDIKIGALDTDSGRVTLSGKINALYYAGESEKDKKGLFSRLVR